MTVAESLSRFFAAVSISDLPADVIEHAKMVVASTIASAARGTQIDSAIIIRDLARERGGTTEASIWFDAGPRLPLTEAAQTNAVLSDASASDDSDLRNIVHSGTPSTAAALAAAELMGATGAEVLVAVVVGCEAAGRLSSAMSLGYFERGFHGSIAATFAATIAAASVLELSNVEMAHAVALAATSIGGLAPSADVSVAREYHAGLATLLGTRAVAAARHGFRGRIDILECPNGFFEAFAGIDGTAAGEHAIEDLGESWDIVTDLAIKLMPGAHANHSFAEAAANAACDGDIAPAEVEAIFVSRPGMTSLSGPRHPKSLVEMAHSPAFFAAAGVADRGFSWEHASVGKITDPVIHDLIEKVQVGDVPMRDIERYRQGATVTIRTVTGRTVTNTVFVPKGAGELGISWTDIDAKYRSLTPWAGLSSDAIASSLNLIHQLDEVDEVSAFVAMLRHSES